MKKVFILTQFGEPHAWTQQYFENVKKLKKYGWYWKIFTPNKLENAPSNVEVVPMTLKEFDQLIEKNCGVNPQNKLAPFPTKPVSDFYIASGQIFQDYLKDADFWGITNWDVVYGRLDHYLTDETLSQCDVWTDDVNIINGVFSLFRNTYKINNLFREVPDWEKKFTEHKLFGTDEYDMTMLMRKVVAESRAVYMYPAYYPFHSYDRLKQHVPTPQLEIQNDGSLWERFYDVNPPIGYVNFPKGYVAKEIMYFHFNYTKTWPPIAYSADTAL